MTRGRTSRTLLLLSFALAVTAAWLLATDPVQQHLMAVTIRLGLRTACLALPFSLILAVLLFRTDVPGRRVVLAVLLTMLLVPVYLQAAAWDAGFGRLGWFTVSRDAVAEPWLSGMNAAAWVHAMTALPWLVFILGMAARLTEPELEEEAFLYGNTWRVLARVTLPRMRGGIALALLWLLVSVGTEMTVTDLFRVRTFAEELYTGFALGDDPTTAWRSALPGICAGASLILLTIAVIQTIPPTVRTVAKRSHLFPLGGAKPYAGCLMFASTVLLVGLPLGSLVYKAGLLFEPVGGVVRRGWSLVHCLQTIGGSFVTYSEEIGWSVLISAGSATAALLVACLLAWPARQGGWRAWPATVIAAVGIALPGPLIGLAVIWLLDRPSPAFCMWLYDQTLLAPLLAVTLRILPLAILICWLVLRTINDDLLDSAAVAGAGFASRFSYVALPLRWSGLLAGWIVLVALASGDLACSILVVPPGVTTVPIRVFGLMHAGVDDQVAGLATAALLALVNLAALVRWLGTRIIAGA